MRSFTTVYSYDAASNRVSLTDPKNGQTSYSYDTLNRLTNLSNFQSQSFGFSYDNLGRRTQLTRPNGVNTNYAYDSLSRLLSVLHQVGSTTLDGASYTYDNAGNRTSKTDVATSVTSNYGYDNIYQLLSVMQGGQTTESYSYDTVGNRLSSLNLSPYSYNSSNQLTSTPNATYNYDNNGNTLSKVASSATTSYVWDFENRLTSVTLPGTGGTVTFKYDPMGRRVQKSGPSGTVNYVYDGNNLLEEVDQNGNVLARYTQGSEIDEELSELRSSITSYYEVDALGTVTSLSNSTGAIVNIYTYDSFGNVTGSTGTLTNPFRYTGREYDPNVGLYYYRARYYDPTAGRFLSEDALRFESGPDFYNYVENSPLNLTDPFGRQSTGAAPALEPPPSPAINPIVAFCDANPAACAVIGIVSYLVSPGVAGDPSEDQKMRDENEKCKRKGRWHCTAKCHVNNFSNLPNIPDFVTGEG